MKKKLLLLASFIVTINGFAQNVLKQVIVVNEGHYDYMTGNIDVPVSIGTYNPINKHYTTIENIVGSRFATDVIIDGDYLYVAADDKIIKYNKNTFVREGVLPVFGVRKLAIWNNHLLVTRGEYGYVFTNNFQVFDKNNLSYQYELTTQAGPQYACEGVVVHGDSAYIAVNNAFDFPNYKSIIGVVNLNAHTYVREINLGLNGTNPDYMTISGDEIFTLNNQDYSTASISKYNVLTGVLSTTSLATPGGCGTSVLTSTDILYQVAGDNQLAKFNTATLVTYDTLTINKNLYGMAYDNLGSNIYAGNTDYISYGKVFIYQVNGMLVDSFAAGVAPGNIALDYVNLTSVQEAKENISVSVYPNPASDKLTLSLSATMKGTFTVGITDLMGRNVAVFELNASERNHSIDISNFAAGTYIMKIQNTEINKVIKITKE